MAKFIVSYDLEDTEPSPYSVFLEKAEENGWDSYITSAGKRVCKLPNTTLIGDFLTLDDAVTAFKKAGAETEKVIKSSVKITKWIITEYISARLNSDEKY